LTLTKSGFIDLEKMENGIKLGKASLDENNTLVDQMTAASDAMKAAFPADVVTTVLGVESVDEN
jgi:hypothetical protein